MVPDKQQKVEIYIMNGMIVLRLLSIFLEGVFGEDFLGGFFGEDLFGRIVHNFGKR